MERRGAPAYEQITLSFLAYLMLFEDRLRMRSRRSLARNILMAGLLPLCAAALLAGCGSEPPNGARSAPADMDDAQVIQVETLVLEPTVFQDVIQLTGAVEAFDDARLSAQTSGTVIAIEPLGAFVRNEGAVAQINPSVSEAAVSQARAIVEAADAQFGLARENLTRNEPLFADSVISAIEWESVQAQYNQAKANLAQAEAALDQARTTLAQTRVEAPFSGTVEEHFVEPGEQVTPGMAVARLINTRRVKVVSGVPERYAADIVRGTPVRIGFEAYRGDRVDGQVSFVGRAVDPLNRTFPIEIVINNPDGTVKPEMVARVEVTREIIEDALVLPRAAVIRTENGHIAYLVETRDGALTAVQRNVIPGPDFGAYVVATNLAPGDEVIVLGQSKVIDGDRVEIAMRHAASGTMSPEQPEIPTDG